MMRRAIFWAFSGQIATFALSFVGSIVVARLLSPHELGVYAVSTAALGIIQVATAFGVGAYVMREPELDQRMLDTAFTVNALLSLALALVTFAASGPAARFLEDDAVASVLRLLALTPILSILEFRPTALLQREMKFGVVSVISVARTAASVVVTILTAYYGYSYLSPAYGALAASTVGLAGFLLLGRQHFGLGVSLHGWRSITRFGLQMMSITGISVAAVRMSDIVMGKLLGITTLGLYSRAGNLSNIIFNNIYGTATRVVFSKLAQDYRERGVVRDTFLPGLRMITALLGPIVIGIAILAGPIVMLLYGRQWIDAAPVLSLLLVAQFVSLSFAMNWELFVVRDELKLQTKFEVARSLCGLTTRAIGCLFGILGAAAASIVDAFFSIWLYAPHMRRMADTRRGELTGIYGESTVLTLVATAPSLALMTWFRWSADTSISLAAASALIGAALWLAMIVRTKHPLAGELATFYHLASRRLRRGEPVDGPVQPIAQDER